MKSTVWPALTALDSVKMMFVPEMEMPVMDLLTPLTRTANDEASTPVPSMVSSKLRVKSVGEEVLTLPPVKPGA